MPTQVAPPAALFALLLALAGCGAPSDGTESSGAPPASPAAPPGSQTALPACDPDNGGITLPEGFCAAVIADGVGSEAASARHITVAPNGDLYVAVQGKRGPETPAERGGVIALRDTDGDGRMDQRVRFGPSGGTGLELRGDALYFAPNDAVLRFAMTPGRLEPAGPPDTLVRDLPDGNSHTAKSLAFGADGALYVNVGSPTNACQPVDRDRRPGVRGLDPCPQLQTRAGIWRFDASRTGQTQADGERWSTGLRNAVALAHNPADGALYAVQHGRDQLNLWPGFTDEQSANQPAEEMVRLERGADFGWPYCFFDPAAGRKVLAPEYGGNGTEVGRCADKAMPVVTFPAHWAPNDLVFYDAGQFPPAYRGGAFVAWHGSWNRAPLPQGGYKVSFVPPAAYGGTGEARVFADGFTGPAPQPGTAEHRPMGLAVGPDGSLYIASSVSGRIWRVIYTGTGS